MTLLTFRDKNTSGDPVGPTWYLNFDALTTEELTRSAEVTQYPVETGATLSDHYQPLPREIRLSGVVSETPTGSFTNLDGMQNAAKPMSMVERPLRLTIRPSAERIGPAGVLRPLSTSFLPGRRVIQSNVERATLYIPKFALTLQRADGSVDSDRNQFSPARSTATRITSFVNILDGIMESRTVVAVVLQTGVEYQNMMITDFRAPRVAGSSGSVSVSIDMQEIVLADPVQTRGSATRSNAGQKSKTKRRPRSPKKPKTGTKEANRIDKTGMPDAQAKSLIARLKAAQ